MNNKVDKNSPICQKCQMKYARKDNPIGHWRSRHSINIVVPCKLCGKMFKIQCTKSNLEFQNSNHSGAKIKNVKIESLIRVVKSEPESNSDIMGVVMAKATSFKTEQLKTEMIKREIGPVTQSNKNTLKSTISDFIAKSIAKSELKSEPTVYSNVVYFSKYETTVRSEQTIKSNTKAKSQSIIPKKPTLKRSWPKIYDFVGYSKKIKLDPNSSIENVELNQSEQDSNAPTCGSLMAKLKALEAKLDEMNKEFEIQTKQSEENLNELKAKAQEESNQFVKMTTELTNKGLLKQVTHMSNVLYM